MVGVSTSVAKGTGSQPINARVETVASNGYFKSAFAKHRCLIPANGWYEWIKDTSPKQPHFLARADEKPLFSLVYFPSEAMEA
ncbi:hypothetical protein HSBAA_47060 [Vreelandella sulfidaeris]|uniref:Abasic site processing protein n=1 Tax=Vreelandella sulfidaeris TaxID=115553 RepID=A0A455UB01_9GAMM|nr:hypothetical protein HSBAA_47060 [Halomonas sulfidaeris]